MNHLPKVVNNRNRLKFAALPFFLFLAVIPANALVLRGVVVEVRDGQTIIVNSGGRKLAVLLKAVDAPELKQEFGDVSQKHLASLILEKSVDVEFSQLQSTHVVAKVTCEKLDIGLQVIRDGAAWYDRSAALTLNEDERVVYDGAEKAARSESRGLWQDGSPMPPWEWRRAEAEKNSPQFVATYKSGSARTLGTEDLLFARRSPVGSSTGGTSARVTIPKPTAKPLNTPGQDLDFRSYLTQGRISIVYFYADWCPACRGLNPAMDVINAKVPDMQVLFMNIGDWGTPITRLYGITSVPHLKIFDKNGSLVAEGKTARDWLLREIDARAKQQAAGSR